MTFVSATKVLLDAFFVAKVCDFGLGRAFDSEAYYRVKSETLLPLRWTDPWAIEHQVRATHTRL